jgi:hypothetical protein
MKPKFNFMPGYNSACGFASNVHIDTYVMCRNALKALGNVRAAETGAILRIDE